jgi:uncharacterized protein (TIGR03792 family)
VYAIKLCWKRSYSSLQLYFDKFANSTEGKNLVIELLRFKVAAELRESYIQKDAEIWTIALAKYPGFLGKEVWINPHDATEVMMIIRWATREQWLAIPQAELKAIEDKFAQALGNSYELLESSEYQVRKFPNL